jgi:hypothetical protein
MVVVMRLPLALGLMLVSLTTPVWGQNREQPANGWFRVSWQPRLDTLSSTIEGRVYNDSPFRVTDVRLKVEGLNGDSRPVGQRFTWAYGDIVPGGQTAFLVEAMPRAVTYRVTVSSFDLVSEGQVQTP